MHCPLRPGHLSIHFMSHILPSQKYSDTRGERQIWVSGPLSYNKTVASSLSGTQIQPHFCNGLAQVSSLSLLNNSTNYPTLCYLVPLALSFLATLLLCNQRVSLQNAYLPMSHPAPNLRSSSGQCSLAPTSPDTCCPLSPRRLLTILQTKHTLSKTYQLSLSTMSFFYYSTYWTWLSFDCKGFPDAKWISPIFSTLNKPL